ncbi:MAG TPA: hypothetical protein PLL23_00925 [Chitinophagaceae bacterium]|nr:hypothetical protein [Chitinophagaceae bacterium]
MGFQEYIIKLMVLSASFYAMILLFNKKKNASLELYAAALRHENDGLYDAAVSDYEQALQEQEKLRFRDARLIAGIQEKLKVLHTIISYNKSFQAVLIKPAV